MKKKSRGRPSINKAAVIRQYGTIPNKVVAANTGYTLAGISSIAVRNGLKKSGYWWTKKEEKFILRHFKNDMTIQVIADTLGRSWWAVINKYRLLTRKR